VLPFEKPAAYYLGRYIGRGIVEAEWDVRVGKERVAVNQDGSEVGHSVTVSSAELPKMLFHQSFARRKK